MLNESQKRTKRAALVLALISSTPASTAGWLPTMPMLRPASRAKPTTIFSAKFWCTSMKESASIRPSITSRMS
uniref:Uncharacterized protein n=1 Tax=Tanacetum cinerariifolium TaxID=118510 RepID=A0A699XDQ4_TANCI|nr:hypothetical protein [Tanacetum cinerariifolium]